MLEVLSVLSEVPVQEMVLELIGVPQDSGGRGASRTLQVGWPRLAASSDMSNTKTLQLLPLQLGPRLACAGLSSAAASKSPASKACILSSLQGCKAHGAWKDTRHYSPLGGAARACKGLGGHCAQQQDQHRQRARPWHVPCPPAPLQEANPDVPRPGALFLVNTCPGGCLMLRHLLGAPGPNPSSDIRSRSRCASSDRAPARDPAQRGRAETVARRNLARAPRPGGSGGRAAWPACAISEQSAAGARWRVAGGGGRAGGGPRRARRNFERRGASGEGEVEAEIGEKEEGRQPPRASRSLSRGNTLSRQHLD